MKLTKIVKFPAGHRLMYHTGLCQNLHGHNFVCEVIIYGEVDKKTGMVVDFSEISKIIKNHFDHAVILNKEDIDLINLVLRKKWKLYIIEGEPTSENISLEIRKRIKSKFPDIVVFVVIFENDDSSAEIEELEDEENTPEKP